MLLVRWTILALTLALATGARGDPSPEDAARSTTNPFPLANTLQIQPAYSDLHAGGNATQLLVRLGIVYRSLFIPGVHVLDFYTFARLEMYAEALNQPAPATSAVGLQNWNALWLGAKPFAWGAQVGLGVNAVLPTSTNAALDSQEFQLGPATGAVITRVPHLEIGVLAQFLFSVAGTTPDLAYVRFQPVITYHLPRAFFLETDPIMKFDFKQSPTATVPVNLHFGRGLTPRFALSVIGEYVTTGSGHGNFTIQLNLAYVNW